ncbi:MAG: AIR carboxylase family protein [Acidimicrobiales bacterium]
MSEVVVLIGSATDRSLVRDSKMHDVFEAAGLLVPVHVISCHRNATELERFCRETSADVIIAAAGLAAALPGAVAAATKMRKVVIGVPLDDFGVDTCIRLPGGVPVLTAGVGKAGLFNAAIAACQIVSLGDAEVRDRLDTYLTRAVRAPQFDVSLENA